MFLDCSDFALPGAVFAEIRIDFSTHNAIGRKVRAGCDGGCHHCRVSARSDILETFPGGKIDFREHRF